MKNKFRKQEIFRYRFSISQQQMADYLGVKYSLMAMYESGERTLPTPALEKMGWLEADFETSSKITKAETGNSVQKTLESVEIQEEKIVKKLSFKLKMSEYKAGKLAGRLEQLTKKQADLRSWLNLIDEKLLSETERKFTGWWTFQQANAINLLTKISHDLIKLEIDLDLLRATLAVHERHHERMKKG